MLAALALGATGCSRRDAGSDARSELEAAPVALADAAAPARFVGSETCKTCHAREYAAWRGSQHQRAMQHAGPETILGNFESASLQYRGIETRFTRRGGKYFVTTDGPRGQLATYEVKYTFGVAPLQQY